MQSSPVKGVLLVGVASIIIGIIFIIAGAITTGIAFTMITPPNYDENYDRYIGSNVARLMGPFILIFGLFIIVGACVIMGYSEFHKFQKSNQMPPPRESSIKQEYQRTPQKDIDEEDDYDPKATP